MQDNFNVVTSFIKISIEIPVFIMRYYFKKRPIFTLQVCYYIKPEKKEIPTPKQYYIKNVH